MSTKEERQAYQDAERKQIEADIRDTMVMTGLNYRQVVRLLRESTHGEIRQGRQVGEGWVSADLVLPPFEKEMGAHVDLRLASMA